MCTLILACFWHSECINKKYDGAQCLRSLLKFYSLFRNICWFWFSFISASFRFFLLFFDLNTGNSFVFNRIIDTRVQICQINVVRYIILLRGVHVYAGRRDRAVAQHLAWRACVKISQGPCTTTTEIANIILTLEMSAKFAPLCNALLAIKCCRSAKCQYTALLQHKQQHKHLHESNGRWFRTANWFRFGRSGPAGRWVDHIGKWLPFSEF